MLQALSDPALTRPATAAWAFQVVGPIVWLVLVVWVVRKSRREGRIAKEALILVAATSMWWQEWYGDWATYLLYNPHFTLIPWHSTTWTSPNKPWAVIPAYGWYYTLEFLILAGLIKWVRRIRPAMSPTAAAVVVGIPLFYLVDLLIEGGAAKLGMWSYTSHVGPVLTFAGRTFPLIYPILFFTAWCTVTGVLITEPNGDGQTHLDRLLRLRPASRRIALPADTQPAGGGAVAVAVRPKTVGAIEGASPAVRIAAWIFAFNASYWVIFILPLVLIRQFGGHASTLVP